MANDIVCQQFAKNDNTICFQAAPVNALQNKRSEFTAEQALRIELRHGDQDGLGARGFAFHQYHRASRQAQAGGDECHQRLIGLAIHRRRGDANLEGVAMQADDPALLRAGLDVQTEQPAVGSLAIPRWRGRHRVQDGQIGAASIRASVASGMSSTCATMIMNNGERSMLPMGGMKRRKGR